MSEAPQSLLRYELYRGSKLAVRRSRLHRWGVFALETIRRYELLEEAPYFAVAKEELTGSPICEAYSYWLSDDTSLLAMGCAGLYNHSFEPNADFELDRINEVIRHYALRDIEAGEELTLDYGEENAGRFLQAA